MKNFTCILFALLSMTAQAAPVGAAYQPYRMGSSGTIPAFGAIDLSQSAAVTGVLGAANGGATDLLGVVNCSVAATVAANAVTFSLKDAAGAAPSSTSPCKIGFSLSSAVDGGYSYLTVTSATSVTISSGSTLGHTSTIPSRIFIYALNNAGTVILGASSINLGDFVQSSTAEGGAGAADSATVIYTTSAVSGKAARVLYRFTSTQTTAGTWAAGMGDSFAMPDYTQAIYANVTGGTGTVNSSFNTTQWTSASDIFGMSVASGVFTIQYPGLYSIVYTVNPTCTSSALGDYMQLRIQKNGGGELNYTTTRYASSAGATSLSGMPVHATARFIAGDNIRGQVSTQCAGPGYNADTSEALQIVKIAD